MGLSSPSCIVYTHPPSYVNRKAQFFLICKLLRMNAKQIKQKKTKIYFDFAKMYLSYLCYNDYREIMRIHTCLKCGKRFRRIDKFRRLCRSCEEANEKVGISGYYSIIGIEDRYPVKTYEEIIREYAF